jgi:PAS domain S-box-containing protein
MSHVLLVDDKEENLYYLTALLQGSGHTVGTARHGAEALVMARQRPPDVVISDLLMPVMDGYTLLRHWKADPRLRDIPFIVYTATYTEEEDERLALNLGADAFILKPAEPEAFLARLREVQGVAAASDPTPTRLPAADEKALLKLYSETLIRKLEEKMLQLEQTNQALERDIAERKLVEEALRKSEAEFRLLTEAMPQIVWIAGPDGLHRHFNRRWTEYTGMSLEDSLGHGWLDAFHPEDQSRVAAAWQAAVTSGRDYVIEYRLGRQDGTWRWMLGRAVPVRDDSGAIHQWFGTSTDIHDLKGAQARIAEQAALLDAAHDAIYLMDLDDRIIYWNKGAERTYGWTAAETLGKRCGELLRKDVKAHREALVRLMKQGEWQGELAKYARDGRQVTVDVHWSLVRDERGKPKAVLAINTDITEKKRLEAEFLRAQRMESIGTLAGGIAHDLNNVLAPIMMAVEMLRQQAGDEHSRSLLDTLQTSTQRGADLVRQVLSFARGVDGNRVPVDPLHVLNDVGQIIRETFPKNIGFELEPVPDLWPVTGDPTQIHQVLMNLCVNARDAMPDGGRLTVTAENVVLDDAGAGLAPGPYVLIRVTDTGTGVARGIRERIFEPFFTTREQGKGTGLGLSTSLAIVRSHGGAIRLETEEGRGSTFLVWLPASREQLAADGGAPGAARLPRGQGELVLVVDDEEAIRRIAAATLEHFGYLVLLAKDGSEAVARYAEHQDEIAVVLTDMAMPVMDGPALILALRAMNPKVRIVGFSGLASQGAVAGTVGSGLEHFLSKPYTAESLLTKLREVLDSP